MGAEAKRQAFDADFQNAAQRVAFLALGVDQRLHRVVLIGIQAIDFAPLAQGALFFERAGLGNDFDAAKFDDIAEGHDAKGLE